MQITWHRRARQDLQAVRAYIALRENTRMEVAVSLPDHIVQHLQEKHPDVPRYVLESIALEGYRSRTLTTEEVRQLLGLEDRFAVHEFLAAHDVPFYTLDDLRHDLATLDHMQPQ